MGGVAGVGAIGLFASMFFPWWVGFIFAVLLGAWVGEQIEFMEMRPAQVISGCSALLILAVTASRSEWFSIQLLSGNCAILVCALLILHIRHLRDWADSIKEQSGSVTWAALFLSIAILVPAGIYLLCWVIAIVIGLVLLLLHAPVWVQLTCIVLAVLGFTRFMLKTGSGREWFDRSCGGLVAVGILILVVDYFGVIREPIITPWISPIHPAMVHVLELCPSDGVQSVILFESGQHEKEAHPRLLKVLRQWSGPCFAPLHRYSKVSRSHYSLNNSHFCLIETQQNPAAAGSIDPWVMVVDASIVAGQINLERGADICTLGDSRRDMRWVLLRDGFAFCAFDRDTLEAFRKPPRTIAQAMPAEVKRMASQADYFALVPSMAATGRSFVKDDLTVHTKWIADDVIAQLNSSAARSQYRLSRDALADSTWAFGAITIRENDIVKVEEGFVLPQGSTLEQRCAHCTNAASPAGLTNDVPEGTSLVLIVDPSFINCLSNRSLATFPLARLPSHVLRPEVSQTFQELWFRSDLVKLDPTTN